MVISGPLPQAYCVALQVPETDERSHTAAPDEELVLEDELVDEELVLELVLDDELDVDELVLAEEVDAAAPPAPPTPLDELDAAAPPVPLDVDDVEVAEEVEVDAVTDDPPVLPEELVEPDVALVVACPDDVDVLAAEVALEPLPLPPLPPQAASAMAPEKRRTTEGAAARSSVIGRYRKRTPRSRTSTSTFPLKAPRMHRTQPSRGRARRLSPYGPRADPDECAAPFVASPLRLPRD